MSSVSLLLCSQSSPGFPVPKFPAAPGQDVVEATRNAKGSRCRVICSRYLASHRTCSLFAMELPLRQPEISKNLQNSGVGSAIGDDDTAIGTQLAAVVEVQGPAQDVGHGSSGFLDDQGSGGVIPYLLAVISPGRHAEIDFRLAPRNYPVLGLAVHPDGWRHNPQPRRDRSGVSMRTVA